MHRAIGPFDGRRARRKRCDACVKRRIKVRVIVGVVHVDSEANQEKCHGGIPCQNCTRTQQPCEAPTKSTGFTLTYVEVTGNMAMRMKVCRSTPLTAEPDGLSIPQALAQKTNDNGIPYFFTSFLVMNNFTNRRVPVITELLSMMQDAPALRAAVCAVAACHRSQEGPTTLSRVDQKNETMQTLQLYGESVCHVKRLISSNAFMEDEAASWTTFFLGLFEVGGSAPKLSSKMTIR